MAKVPNDTGIASNKQNQENYQIHFAPELIPLIESGEKKLTYRYGSKYDYLKVGDEVTMMDYSNPKIEVKAIIIGKEHTTFGALPFDRTGHEIYRDKNHQKEVFSGYYHYLGRAIQDKDPFIIFEFNLL